MGWKGVYSAGHLAPSLLDRGLLNRAGFFQPVLEKTVSFHMILLVAEKAHLKVGS